MSTATEIKRITCPACGTANRIALERLGPGKQPVCGRCQAPLAEATHPLTVTDASFAHDVEQSSMPVLLDCWAAWCGPCRIVAPTIDQLASELAGRVRVAKLDVDSNPAVASRFDVRSIPTLLVLQRGREVDRIVGAASRSEILRRLAAAGIIEPG